MKATAAISATIALLYLTTSSALASVERLQAAAKGVDETVQKVDVKQAIDDLALILEIEPEVLAKGINHEWTMSGLAVARLIAERTGETVQDVLGRIPDRNWLQAIRAAEIPAEVILERFDDLHAELAFMALDWRDGRRRR